MQLALRTGAFFVDKNEATSKKINKTKEEIMSDKRKHQQWQKHQRNRIINISKNKNISKTISKNKSLKTSAAATVGQEIDKMIKSEEKVKNVYLCTFDQLFWFTKTTGVILVGNVKTNY